MAPTPLDRLTTSKNAFFAFAGIIVGVSAWAILSDSPIIGGMDEPWGDVTDWTLEELRAWLRARNVEPSEDIAREELVAIVQTAKRGSPV